MRIRNVSFLFTLLSLLLFIASCGPAAPATNPDPPSEPNTGEEDSNTQDNAVTEAEQEEAPAANPEKTAPVVEVAGDTVTTQDGIQVGFTAEGRPVRGNAGAPVLIEEFSDYQCPFCARFTQQTMPALLENQIAAGEAAIVYYDFPLENIHPQAFAAANAARCAGEQGAQNYWRMHDKLYEEMAAWGIPDPNPVFLGFAEELALDMDRFEPCQTELRFSDQINADIEHGISRGVRSTPSFFLNDQPLIGAQPLEAFNQAIAMVSSGDSIATEPPPPESPLQPPPVKPEPAAIDTENYAATMGDPNAPVTIVEFTDYQCPFCQSYSQETLPLLAADQIATGEVYYILKDLPLDSIHPNARAAAKAARCAGEQDTYWEMHDALFDNQDRWSNLPRETFLDLAANLGLDRDQFTACLDSDEMMMAIQANVDEASALGADSTPYFFVDGLPIPGAQPYELFDFAITEAKEGRLADAYVPADPDLENAYAVGDPDAPVTIVEFTDYQCPFCSRHFEQTFTQIKENYIDTGLVYYIFKDFPLTQIHPQAIKAAEAARCAGEQDAYLAMHDQLFRDQAAWSGNEGAAELFKQYAQDLSLDTASFNECLDSGRTEEAVLADLANGQQAGVGGTPAFFINRHTMSGAQPYAVFEEAIEQFLYDEG